MEQIDAQTYRIFDESDATLAFVKCISQRRWGVFDQENNPISDMIFPHAGKWLDEYRKE
jgi:hypothetical protein